jgi:hypothetical protein
MRGVGDEPTLGLERRFQPRQQVVEGVAELPELVVRSPERQPLAQIAGRDRPGGGGDLAQGTEDAAGDEPAQRHRRDRAESEHQRGDRQKPLLICRMLLDHDVLGSG